MRKRGMAPVMLTLAILLSVAGGWTLTYPSATDPKNIQYVLWKAGLWNLDIEQATTTMIADRARDRLVVGKTRMQLQARFGSLVEPISVSPYLRSCYRNSSWAGRHVLFIAGSSWMVVFNGDRATALVLIKGC
jgi:hypothetical protein